MTRWRRILGVVPPLVVGASAAGAAEMSAGLLLYSSEGFLPALTLILTVETGAFALGLWSGSLQVQRGAVEGIRRRWLFSLVAFAVAAAFSTGVTFLEELFTGGLGQGLGLAFLGSLPLFALGSLLSGMANARVPSVARVGVPSVVGVALGFFLTGGFLLPNMAPYTLYLLCLTALSGGALVHGWILDTPSRMELHEELWTPRGLVRVEDREEGRGGEVLRVILEGGRLRGAETLGGKGGRDWEKAVLAALKGEARNPGPLLYLGGGSGTLASLLLNAFPTLQLLVLEGGDELVSLARKHFHPFDRWGEVQLEIGEPWALLGGLQGIFPLVLVDLGALPSLGDLPDISRSRWVSLAGLAGPEGCVVLGGLAHPEALGQLPLDALLKEGANHFSRTALYQGEEGAFILLSGPEAPFWSPVLPGFHATTATEE